MSPERSSSAGRKPARSSRARASQAQGGKAARSAARSDRRRALIVLGMHRSGTSALTRVLGLAGAALPRHPMGASELNPRGFFESIPIYELHEEMLEAFGSAWDDLAPMPDGWERSGLASQFADRMVEIVRDEYGESPLIVIKDPRLCRLVPFWIDVLERLEIEPAFILPVRNPLEVSASLARAQGIDEQRGRLLWLQHFIHAERDTRGRSRCVLTYDQLLEDWRSATARLSEELDLALPRMSRRAGAEIDAFLTESLRHHEVPTEGVQVRSDVADWVKKAYRWAQRAAHGKPPSYRTLDAVAAAFVEAEGVFGPVVAASEYLRREEVTTANRLREELEEQAAQLSAVQLAAPESSVEARMDELVDSIKVLGMWMASTQAGARGGGEQFELLLKELDDGGGERLPDIELMKLVANRELADAGADANERIQALEAELSNRDFEIARLEPFEARVAELEAGLSGLEAALGQRDAELGVATDQLANVEREASQLRLRAAEAERVTEQLAASEADRDAWRQRATEHDHELVELRLVAREAESLRANLQAAADAQRELASAAAAREAELTGRARRDAEAIAARDAELDQLRDRAGRADLLEAELVTFRESNAASQAALEDSREELERLVEVADRVPELEAKLDARAFELKGLRDDVARIPRLRARLLESEAALERAKENSKGDLEARTQEIRAVLEEREAEVVRLAADAAQMPKLRERLVEREAELERAEAELDRMREAEEEQRLRTVGEVFEEEEFALWNDDSHFPGPLYGPVVGSPDAPAERRDLFAAARHVAKLVYWTLTFQILPRLRDQRTIGRLLETGLFDDGYYRARCPNLPDEPMAAINHYVRHGVEEGRDPNAAFDTRFYLETNPDVVSLGLNPLDHFASHGWLEGRNPHPYFDVSYYLAVNPDVVETGENALHHWLYSGWVERRSPFRKHSTGRVLPGASRSFSTSASRAPQGVELAQTQDSPRRARSLGETPPSPLDTERRREAYKKLELAPGPEVRFEVESLPVEIERTADPDDPIVVVATHELPYPPRQGNQYRIFRYIHWLESRGYQVVTVHCPLPGAEHPDDLLVEAAQALENLVVCHRDGRMRVSLPRHLAKLVDGLDGTRPGAFESDAIRFTGEEEDEYRERQVIERTFCPDALAHTLVHINEQIEGPSVLITAYAFVTRYLPRLSPDTLKVIDTIDVFSSKADKVDAFGVSGELRLSELQERKLLMRADLTMAIQPAEGLEFERIAPEQPVLTVGVDFDCAPESSAALPAKSGPVRLGLVASGNAMNMKGVNDFLRHCWPLVRRDHPDAILSIAGEVGRSVPPETPGVEILGKLPSLDELYRASRVILNPTAAGTGLKIKTLESLAHYRPIVTWPLGVDGVPEPLLRFCSVATDWYEFYLAVSKALATTGDTVSFDPEARRLISETLSGGAVYRLLGDEIDQHCRGAGAPPRDDA